MRAAAGNGSPLATVPFDQTRRYLVDGSYQGWEHDLGAESGLWTGRPALADGGWSPPASATVSYLTTLLDRRDPAFSPILGALGVKDVLSLDYSPTAPNLVNQADPNYQQQAAAAMPALTLSQRSAAGALYGVDGAAAQLSARPLRAVVLGGLSGLRALVRLPGIVPSRWAAEDAAQQLSAGGEGGLLAAIRQANLVMVADVSVNDLAVVAATPLAELPGISSDPELARATQTVPPDVATRTGTLVDPDAVAPLAGAWRSSVSFTLPRAQPAVELWAHVQALYDAARLGFSIDGRTVGSATPVAPAGAGFSWVRIATRGLPAGRHVLSVRATGSPYGKSYELDAVRLVSASARLRADQALGMALAQAAPRTAYAADLSGGLRTVSDPGLFTPAKPVGGGDNYWKMLDPHRSALSNAGGTVSLSFSAGRRYHALLAHYFRKPRNWSTHAYAFLRVRGQASGASYSVLLDGDARHQETIQLPWVDNSTGWRLLAIPLLNNRAVARHVVSLRVAADDTSRGGRLEIGALALSGSADAIVEHLPIPASAARRATIVSPRQHGAGRRGSVDSEWGARGRGAGISARIPLSAIGQHTLLLVPPRAGIPTAPAALLSWRRAGTDRFSFTVRAKRPTTLVLGLSQDPHWELAGVPGAVATRSWGALQAWRIPAGQYTGKISFAGDGLVRTGLAASAIFLLVLALFGVGLHRRVRRVAGARVRLPGRSALRSHGLSLPRPAGRISRPTIRLPIPPRLTFAARRLAGLWQVPWFAALALLVPIPIVVTSGPNATGDALAVAATIAISLAVVCAGVLTRRSCADDDS